MRIFVELFRSVRQQRVSLRHLSRYRRIDELEKTAGLKAETANEQSARSPGQAITVQTDVTSETSVADLFAQADYCFGRIDVLFNNAGAAAPAIPLDELEAMEGLVFRVQRFPVPPPRRS